MENEKNNAVEKAEKAMTGGNSASKTKKKSSAKKSVASKKKANAKQKTVNEKRAQKALLKQERKEKRRASRAEKEKIRAEKRVELARIKAHKKAEKQKAKATALRERNRRIAEHKAKKEQIKAEKARRRDMLKKETKKQRQDRIAREKAMRLEERKHKREQKRERYLAKKAEREQKRKSRDRRKERNRGYGGWLAAVISLGVATLVLASVLTFTFMMPTEADMTMEASYQKSFYDTVEQVNNMDVNLSKALATKDSGALQTYLVDLAINSELAENDIQQLPLQDESKFYTTKIINQIGDYAKYLNKKLINGETLTQTELANLNGLYKANSAIRDSLAKMMEGMGNDYSFSSMIDGGNGNLVIENFNQLQNLSVEYPELIYDGPFSDGLDRKEIKGLQGESVSADKAADIYGAIFHDYNPVDIMKDGMTEGAVKCHNITGMVGEDMLYAQISEQGGKLIMFAYAGSCNAVNIDGDFATEKAIEFLSGMGVADMKPVWINLSNNVYTINLAYGQNGIIIYSDLIKVRVCAETAKVIGMEATGYYTNHTQRAIVSPALSKAQAEAKLLADIDVLTCRLAVIPVGEATEKLCYEFSGTLDNSTYYIYIDAVSGKQVQMFKVVKSTEGELLI